MYHADVPNTISLSEGYVLGATSGSRKGKWDLHSKNRERGKEAPELGSSLLFNWGHVLLMTFANVLMISSYNLRCLRLPQRDLSSQRGVSLEWKWLL